MTKEATKKPAPRPLKEQLREVRVARDNMIHQLKKRLSAIDDERRNEIQLLNTSRHGLIKPFDEEKKEAVARATVIRNEKMKVIEDEHQVVLKKIDIEHQEEVSGIRGEFENARQDARDVFHEKSCEFTEEIKVETEALDKKTLKRKAGLQAGVDSQVEELNAKITAMEAEIKTTGKSPKKKGKKKGSEAEASA